MTIKKKLILFFVGISVLSATLVGFLFFMSVRSLLQEKVLEEHQFEIDSKVQEIDIMIERYASLPLLIHDFPPIEGIIRARKTGVDELDRSDLSQWIKRLQTIFKRIAELDPVVDQIRYLDETGRELVRVNRRDEKQIELVSESNLQDKSREPYFKEVMMLGKGELYVSEMDLNREHGKIEVPYKPVLRFATPVYSDAGDKKGIIIINILMQPLLDSIRRSTLGSIVMINQNGNFLIHKDKNKEYSAFLNDTHNFFKEHPEISENLKVGQSKVHIDHEDKEYRIWKKIFYHPETEGVYWVLFSVISQKELFAALVRLQNIFIIIGIINMFLIAFLSFIIAQSIAKPIQRLRQGVAIIRQGNMDYRVGMNTKDELGELSQAFDQMVTARKKVEEDARRLAAIVEYSDDAILSKTLDGIIISWNQGAERLYGYSAEEIIGKSILMLAPVDQHSKIRGYMKKIGQGESLAHEDTIRLHKSGLPIHVSLSLSPVKDGAGKIVAVSSVTRDITERKRAEDALKELKDNLEKRVQEQSKKLIQAEKMSALGVMAAGVAHELNNPMMGVLNYVQYSLKHTQEGSKVYEVLSDAERESKRCVRIVQDILTFARSSRRDGELLAKGRIQDVFSRVIATLEPKIKKNGVSVQNDISDQISAIPLDEDKIEQVFLNLMSNAADALKDKPVREVLIEAEQKEGSVQIKVSDTGAGIPLEIQSKIFDPFFTTKPTGEGTGLGLSICRSIIEDHGGELTFKSALNKGTTFWIILPTKSF